MLLVHLMQDMTSWLPVVIPDDSWQDFLQPSIDWSLLAQQGFNTDVFAGARSSFDHFIKTGQGWALLIGLILGYLIRGFTTYG